MFYRSTSVLVRDLPRTPGGGVRCVGMVIDTQPDAPLGALGSFDVANEAPATDAVGSLRG
jgi:hypothetical protein